MSKVEIIEHSPEAAQYSDKYIEAKGSVEEIEKWVFETAYIWEDAGVEFYRCEVEIAEDGSTCVARLSGWKEEPEGFEERIERELVDRETGDIVHREVAELPKKESENE